MEHITKLKDIIINDNKRNNINFEVTNEDYFEFEIDKFNNFLNDKIGEIEKEFEICGHKW